MKYSVLLLFLLVSHSVVAGLLDFKTGPVFGKYGKHHPVDDLTFDKQQKFKVAFDVASQSDVGSVNRKFDSLARFINMHVANGVLLENIELALVVHGKAGKDLLNKKAYSKAFSAPNANAELIESLQKVGVRIMLCGQSAAAYNIAKTDLLSGIEMPLSAMTAHAQLQQDGFTVNPF